MGKLELGLDSAPDKGKAGTKKSGDLGNFFEWIFLCPLILALGYGIILTGLVFMKWDVAWLGSSQVTLWYILRIIIVIGVVIGVFASIDDKPKEEEKSAMKTIPLPTNREKRRRLYALLLDLSDEEGSKHTHDELEAMCVERGYVHWRKKDESA